MGQADLTAQDAPQRRDEAAAARATRVRYSVLAVGCGLALLTYIHRQSFVRAHPEIGHALALNKEQFGYLQSAFLIGYGLFQVPCGLIGDRLGARHLLTGLVLGWSLLTGLTALAGHFPASVGGPFVFLLAARFLFGVFQAGFFPVWARVMTDWTPVTERASAQGMVWMFSRLGGAVGPFMFLALFDLCGTWTTPFWLLAGLGVLAAVPFWIWFRNRPDEMPQVNAAERALITRGLVDSAAVRGPVPWLALLGSVNVWALCLMYGFVGSAGNFITNLLSIYLEGDRHLSPGATTWLTGLPLAAGIVSCVSGGFLSDWIVRRWRSRKWGRRLNGLVGLVLAGLAIMAVPWAQPVWLLALLLCASFFCNDLIMGPAWAACADIGEGSAGTISGAMNMTGQFFGAAGMAFAGFMLQRGHAVTLFVVFGCAYGLAALCWLAVDVTKPLRIDQNRDVGTMKAEG
ncbi:MAG TPA: MFS transporter [Planctomycetaceae bacterium]|jgi:sugar phosphate permease|nr:MFS transporter [Planctomycetaceae bacterium]